MWFGTLPLDDDAVGAVLVHTHRLSGRVLRKGVPLTSEAVQALLDDGHTAVPAARLEVGDVDEDAAAERVARALTGPGLQRSRALTGRCNLVASERGVVCVDRARVDALNRLGWEITLGTLPPDTLVEAGAVLATVKIIPLAVDEVQLRVCEAAAAEPTPMVRVAPLSPHSAALVLSAQPGSSVTRRDRTIETQGARLEGLGSSLSRVVECAHTPEAVASALQECLDAGHDPVLFLGASAVVDDRDVFPTALRAIGGTVMHVGMPVDPGNLMVLGCHGARSVLGVPGCARSLKPSGFDRVLRRVLAGLPVDGRFIQGLGVGGLLVESAGAAPAPRPRGGTLPNVSSDHRSTQAGAPLDLAALRAELPGLTRRVRGKPLAYLDFAATAQRPRVVLDALRRAHTELNANVHRGVHTVGAEATVAFEAARTRVAEFLGADRSEVVFTRGATESLNLAAQGIAATRLRPRSRILLTQQEHHANLVPWQLVAHPRGAHVEHIPLLPSGALDLETAHRQVRAGHLSVLGLPLISNVLGTRAPVEELAAAARKVGALVVVDAAQAVAHGPLDVHALGADVVAFSGHKLFGPTGIGVLWARSELLHAWPPWQGGGAMIERVSFDTTTYRSPPARFEAGTPPIAAAVGLHAALDWLEDVGWPAIQQREALVRERLLSLLGDIPSVVRLPGSPVVPLASFNLRGVHPHDVGTLLDEDGVAVRTGRHCTDPLHTHLGLDASVRASASFLTTELELERLAAGLRRVAEVFGVR